MEWMLLPIKRYADFSGRSRRQEYWMFELLKVLITGLFGALALVSAFIGTDNIVETGPGPGFYLVMLAWVLVFLALIVPTIAAQVRRFHDQGRSGWFCLFHLVPSVGGIIVLVFMCLEGGRGDNAWGADPKRLD